MFVKGGDAVAMDDAHGLRTFKIILILCIYYKLKPNKVSKQVPGPPLASVRKYARSSGIF